jgi:hypothetical protein
MMHQLRKGLPILLPIPKGAGNAGALKPPMIAPFTDSDVKRIAALAAVQKIEEVRKS